MLWLLNQLALVHAQSSPSSLPKPTHTLPMRPSWCILGFLHHFIFIIKSDTFAPSRDKIKGPALSDDIVSHDACGFCQQQLESQCFSQALAWLIDPGLAVCDKGCWRAAGGEQVWDKASKVSSAAAYTLRAPKILRKPGSSEICVGVYSSPQIPVPCLSRERSVFAESEKLLPCWAGGCRPHSWHITVQTILVHLGVEQSWWPYIIFHGKCCNFIKPLTEFKYFYP